jgi:hypothetical protein
MYSGQVFDTTGIHHCRSLPSVTPQGRSYNVHCATDVQGGKRSSCNTKMHSPTQFVCAWRGFRTMRRNVSISHPLVQTLHYHPLRFVKDPMGGQHHVTNEAVQKLSVVHEPQKMSSTSRRSSNSDNSGKNALIRKGISQSEYSVQTSQTCDVFKPIPFILKLICMTFSMALLFKVSFQLTPTCITQLSVMQNRQNCIPIVPGRINFCVKHRNHFCSS